MGSLIDIYDDVLPESFCKELSDESFDLFTSKGYIWKSNFSWNPQIIRASHGVMVRNIEKEQKQKIFDYLKSSNIIQGNVDEYSCMNYMWTRLSYIPWHNDQGHDEAVTIYLNQSWDADWGGYFMYGTVDDVRCVLPKFNRAVKNTSNVFHSVSMVSLDSMQPRCTIQMFKPKNGIIE